jgi:hypothetical protein
LLHLKILVKIAFINYVIILADKFVNFSLEGKFLVTKCEFRGSFGMSLKGDCNEVEVTPNLEFLVTFGMTLAGICH